MPYFDVGVPPTNDAEKIRQVSYMFLGMQARGGGRTPSELSGAVAQREAERRRKGSALPAFSQRLALLPTRLSAERMPAFSVYCRPATRDEPIA